MLALLAIVFGLSAVLGAPSGYYYPYAAPQVPAAPMPAAPPPGYYPAYGPPAMYYPGMPVPQSAPAAVSWDQFAACLSKSCEDDLDECIPVCMKPAQAKQHAQEQQKPKAAKKKEDKDDNKEEKLTNL
ncbi:hypothetical protein BC940DRAFT_292937 [Gongronella butleri]|nr:hypothetical protein BC940DRAFT_292937 [Gongronella butleri]